MHCCVASSSCGVDGAVGTVSAMHHPGPLPATLLALALLVGSCGAPGPGPALLDVECPGEPVPTLLEVTCGRLALDDVTLFVAVLHAADPTGSPVLFLHGGPGGRAVADRHIWLAPRSPLLEHHDLVLVDQRGSGLSTPSLDCEELDAPSPDVFDAYRACRSRLTDLGIDLARYTVSDVAADLVLLRSALGVDRWSLYGISFGTRVTLELLRTDGSAVVSAVLDSPFPPHVDAYDSLPAGAVAAVDAAFDRCNRLDACAPDLGAKLDTLLDRLDEAPTAVTTRSRSALLLDNVIFARLLTSALAHPDGPSLVPEAVVLAGAGRLAQAVAILEDLGPTGRAVGDQVSEGAQLSSECADEVPFNRFEDPPGPRPLAAAVAGAGTDVQALCRIWEVSPSSATADQPVYSEVDVLLLTGRLDPVTPTAWAGATAEHLPNALLVGSDRWTHGPSLSDTCAEGLVAAFLDGLRPDHGSGGGFDAC